MVVDTHAANDFIMKPLPNHLFTRDTSCWIYNGVSINPMAKKARQRETNNLRAIYRWHPSFANGDFIKYFGDENINYDHSTLEGGDVLVIGRGAVLIGMSERTTPQGIEFLANALFKNKQAERVIALELPKHRSCMHLDTVLTHLDVDTFSVHPEVVRKDAQCWTLTPNGRGGITRSEEKDFLHAIEKALGITQVRLITTGGDALRLNANSGTTPTMFSPCAQAWLSVTNGISGQTRNTTRPASPFYLSRVTNLDAAAAARVA